MKLRCIWSNNSKKYGPVIFLMNLAVIFLNEATTFLEQGLFLYLEFYLIFNICKAYFMQILISLKVSFAVFGPRLYPFFFPSRFFLHGTVSLNECTIVCIAFFPSL